MRQEVSAVRQYAVMGSELIRLQKTMTIEI